MASDRVTLATVVVLGLSAGALLTEGMVLVPLWQEMPPESFLAWYRHHAGLLFNYFGPLEILGAALAVLSAGLTWTQGAPGRTPASVAAVLAVAVLLSFPLYFEAVNASFEQASIGADQVPGELARWARWHWGRTWIGVGAFASAAVVLRRR